MRRSVAILLVVILAASASRASALHIHAYADHDHPEHHHGVAAHEHPTPVPRRDSERPTLKPCDPAVHAVSIAMGCGRLPHVPVIAAECATTGVRSPLIPVRSVRTVTDVRVHGPPLRSEAPPRAPPPIDHA